MGSGNTAQTKPGNCFPGFCCLDAHELLFLGGEFLFGDDAGIASSIHIPYYQTNTSEYCTLYAICANGDRGKQNRVEHCPHYCEKYAFLYPDHLKMIGKGNSLFAFDLEILRNQEILRNYREQGVDRLVIHLL